MGDCEPSGTIPGMKSVADDLSREEMERTLLLSPDERMQIALRLGDEAVAIYAAANGVSESDARRILRQNSQFGRRPSSLFREDR